MLKQRWDKFMCPNGIRRTFNPKRWEHGTPVLVFGELMALISAAAAVPITLLSESPYGQWLLYAAAIIGAGTLFWYALGKSTLGEMPLTGTSARRIAAVVEMKTAEDKMGPVIDRDSINADGTQAMMGFSSLKPELKRELFEKAILPKAAPHDPEPIRQRKFQLFQSLPESVRQQTIDSVFADLAPMPLRIEPDRDQDN